MRRRACIALAALVAAGAWAAPEARLSPGAPLGELPRFGVNLGGRSVWGAEQLMANVLRNPGLEAALDGSLVVAGGIGDQGVVDDTPWTARPPGFWSGARFEVLSGPAAGQRGRVADNRRDTEGGPDHLRLEPMPLGLRPGDVLALQGEQDTAPAPLWWTEGRVRSCDARPGSPGRRAVQLTGSSTQPAALFHHLDSIGARAGKLLPVRGRWRLRLWLRAIAPGARVQLSFGRQGRAPWLDRSLRPGTAWQALDLGFETRDDGPPAPLMLSIRVTKGEVQVDDVELGREDELERPLAGGFRAEVVQTLRSLRPGYLRDWQGQLADAPANRLAGELARQPVRYRPGAHELQFAYSLPEFLALAADVGARPWVVLPSTSTPDEARATGRALAAAWRRYRFDEIVVEHGNEHWNAIFRPAGIAQPAVLAEVADRSFAALREGAGSEVPLHRVVGTPYVDGRAAGRMAALSRQTEGIAVAPYFHHRQQAGETPEAALDRALHEDVQPLRDALAALRPLGRALDVCEVNFHTTGGDAAPARRDAVVTSAAAGSALARRLLQAAALGVQRQAVYALAGYDSFVQGPRRELVQLFGITRDLAGPGHWRSTGEALVALNAVVGGAAHAGRCEGPGCDDLTAMAFGGGTRWAVVNAAAGPRALSWPCASALQLTLSGAATHRVACEKGRAGFDLPARSWMTAAPQP